MRAPTYHHDRAQSGFTIVELMIATLIFSVILLVITAGVMRFTTEYYRGINTSTTQNTARNIIDAVSQAIQFSNLGVTSPSGGGNTYCIGGQQFDYNLGHQVGTAANDYALLQSVVTATCTSVTTPTSSTKELLGPHMRLTYFAVAPIVDDVGENPNQLYTIHVRVAYGDSDLFCAPVSQGGSCAPTATTLTDAQLSAADVRCKTQTGSQFCSVADLITTVQVRHIDSSS